MGPALGLIRHSCVDCREGFQTTGTLTILLGLDSTKGLPYRAGKTEATMSGVGILGCCECTAGCGSSCTFALT